MKQEAIKFKFNLEGMGDFFCVSDKNLFAYRLITSWPKWFKKNAYIYGPPSSGKTLIANIWKKKTNAKIINEQFLNNLNSKENQNLLNKRKCWVLDDLDKILFNHKYLEQKVLYLVNILNENKNYLLITSEKTPNQIQLKIKDLQSRLSAFLVAQLKEPDESLLIEIIKKNFSEKQINISQNFIEYILNRIERTYSAAWNICEVIDQKSLEEKKKISFRFLKKILLETNL